MNTSSESSRIVLRTLMIFFAGLVVYHLGLSPINGAGLIYSAMVVYWISTLRRRPVPREIRLRMVLIGALMLMLLVLRGIRYSFSPALPESLSRFLWYLYYLPFTLIPLLGLDAALLVWNGEDRRSRAGILCLYGACLVLNLLLMTNGLHQLAFRFLETGRQSEGGTRYIYGPVYFAAVLWIAGCAAATLGHLFHENRVIGNTGVPRGLFPVIFIALLYFVGYYLGLLPQLRGRRFLQLPEAYCCFFICLMECSLQAGWFPMQLLRRKETEFRESASSYQQGNQLYEAMASAVSPQLSEITGILDSAPRDDLSFRKEMSRACVLAAFIKRRCNLALHAAGEDVLPPEDLRLAIGESLEYLRLCGVTGAVFLEGGPEPLPGAVLIGAYDFFEQVAEAAMRGAEALLVNIRVSGGAPDSAPSVGAPISAPAGSSAALHSGTLSLRLTLEQPALPLPAALQPLAEPEQDEGVYYFSRSFPEPASGGCEAVSPAGHSGSSPDSPGPGSGGSGRPVLPGRRAPAPEGHEAEAPAFKPESEPLTGEFFALGNLITALTIEKEQLNARIRLHDDLGNMLLTARRYIQGRGDRNSMLSVWRSPCGLLEADRETDEPEDSYAYMQTVARDVGISLQVDGTLPQDPDLKDLMATAIHECMTNTIRHAEGTELRIQVLEDGAAFTNNGIQPEKPIEETGGLALLRSKAESLGVQMQVQSVPEFRLLLRWPASSPSPHSHPQRKGRQHV